MKFRYIIENLKIKIAVNTYVLYFISEIMVYTQQIKMEGIKLCFFKMFNRITGIIKQKIKQLLK